MLHVFGSARRCARLRTPGRQSQESGCRAVRPPAPTVSPRSPELDYEKCRLSSTFPLISVDSGGQYLDGTTTDVTRTMHYGNPSDEIIEMYTRYVRIWTEMRWETNFLVVFTAITWFQGSDGAHRLGKDGAALGHLGLHHGLRLATAALQGLRVK